MRTPRDYQLITKALKEHDSQAFIKSVSDKLGLPIRTGSLLGSKDGGWQFGNTREWETMLNDSGESEKGKEVKEEEVKEVMVEDTEEDDEASIKRKKKKRKKQGKKKTVAATTDENKTEGPEMVETGEKSGKAQNKGKNPESAPTEITTTEDEEADKQLQAAEEGTSNIIPSPTNTYDSDTSDGTTIRATSRRISPELPPDVSRSVTPKPVEMPKEEVFVPEVNCVLL